MRASAADIAAARRRPEDSGVLIALVNDDDIVVRTAAALGLARLVADGEGGIAALAAARRAAADPGRRVPKVVALALSQGKDLSDEAADLLNRLRQHRSSSVRRAAAIRIP
jgi:HEAT repeat protein